MKKNLVTVVCLFIFSFVLAVAIAVAASEEPKIQINIFGLVGKEPGTWTTIKNGSEILYCISWKRWEFKTELWELSGSEIFPENDLSIFYKISQIYLGIKNHNDMDVNNIGPSLIINVMPLKKARLLAELTSYPWGGGSTPWLETSIKISPIFQNPLFLEGGFKFSDQHYARFGDDRKNKTSLSLMGGWKYKFFMPCLGLQRDFGEEPTVILKAGAMFSF